MKYYEYPTSYNWALMPLTYGTTTTQNFIADIHSAINVENSDDPEYLCVATNVSSFVEMSIVLKTQFNFSSATVDYYDYNIVKNNLDDGRPVLLTGQSPTGTYGHMWVCEGYSQLSWYNDDCTGGTFVPLFYMNWGWQDVSFNGYYSYNNFNPDNKNYNADKGMIFDITP